MTTQRERIAIVRTRLQMVESSSSIPPQCGMNANYPYNSNGSQLSSERKTVTPFQPTSSGYMPSCWNPIFQAHPNQRIYCTSARLCGIFAGGTENISTKNKTILHALKSLGCFERWIGHIYFYYASIDEKDLVKETEDALMHSCIPPCNEQYKGIVGRALTAFD